MNKPFDPGLDVRLRADSLSFDFGEGVFGPVSELRKLDEIRPSLRDPTCQGPDPVYGIAMDVGKTGDAEELRKRFLLFGAVAYAEGKLGDEPVRSQGHIHGVAPHCGWSTPELFEIWEGHALIYAQESIGDDPGRCIAVQAGPGDQVVVPPNWAHFVANASSTERMVFVALCERQYSFVYGGVRAHGGLAWFPIIHEDRIEWKPNPRFLASDLKVHGPRSYPELGLDATIPIYRQFQADPERVQWVSEPAQVAAVWPRFEP
ncbi:MAG TPA: glucose-6-phosphate isomerase family protein [Terracidiphilus sp.]|nr:glucose-6-phosphate isomerase family protein [Terracidiphilus sp.]